MNIPPNAQFKVLHLEDDIYQVVIRPDDWESAGMYEQEILYQGCLSECEAYIRLTENGYM